MRHLRPRRARAVLLWGLIWLTGIQLGIGLVIDTRLPWLRDPWHLSKLTQLQARLRENPGLPLSLALGSSRTLRGLQAGRLQLVSAGKPVLSYNFGLEACGPLMQLVTLRRLLNDGIAPTMVLVEVTPFFFHHLPSRPLDEKLLDGTRLQVEELASVGSLCRVPRVMFGNWLQARFLPFYQYSAGLRSYGKSALGGKPATDKRRWFGGDGYGWHAVDLVNERERLAKTAFAMNQYGDYFQYAAIAPHPVHALNVLLELCHERNILAHLVVVPEGAPFRARYPAAFLAALDRVLTDTCRQHHVALTNAQTWLADDKFYDGHHLLPEGAAEFTERLAGRLRSIEHVRSMHSPDSIGLFKQADI